MVDFEQIKIFPLLPGACGLCGVKHGKNAPHERNSLYYVIQFRRKYGRLPEPEDADMDGNKGRKGNTHG